MSLIYSSVSKKLNSFDLDMWTVGYVPAGAFGALWWWWTIHGTQQYQISKFKGSQKGKLTCRSVFGSYLME